jgi:hypothetical protein
VVRWDNEAAVAPRPPPRSRVIGSASWGGRGVWRGEGRVPQHHGRKKTDVGVVHSPAIGGPILIAQIGYASSDALAFSFLH